MPVTIDDRDNESAKPKSQRDARGRFARGNAGGPGNPFGRRLAHLREVLLRSATEENVERLANMLMEKAFAGDLAAAKMLLLYWIGKPKEVAEPDRVDVEEWELAREHVVRPDVAQEAFSSVPITVGIAALPAMAMVHEHQFADMLHNPEKYRQRENDEPTEQELAEEAEITREMRAARGAAAAPSPVESQPTPTPPPPVAKQARSEPQTPPAARRHQTAQSDVFADDLDRHQTVDETDSAAWLAYLQAGQKRAG